MSVIYVKGGTVVTHEIEYQADVLIVDGKIVNVGNGFDVPSNAQVIDASGKYVCPGGIDPHVHIKIIFGPFQTCDDWVSATRAAAAGGTTCLIDFVPIAKGKGHGDVLKNWEIESKKSIIDYSFHMCVMDWNEEVKQALDYAVDHGVTSAKCFLAYKNSIMLGDDKDFLDFFTYAKEKGMLPMTHCEDGEIIDRLQNQLASEQKLTPDFHAKARPNWVECLGATRAIAFANTVQVPLYIVHNTCQESVKVIENSCDGMYPVFGEVTICHLTKTDSLYTDENFDKAAGAVLSPPLRTETDRQYLWNSIRRGNLITIGTDHCPFKLEAKRLGKGDFRKIPNGCPAVEERMVLTWSYGVNTGLISPSEYVALTSTNSAKVFGMYPQKGAIQPGSDADIVIIDPKAKRVIKVSEQKSNVDYNLWDGEEVTGIPVVTISNGKVIWECQVENGFAKYAEGKFSGQSGEGKFIARKPFTPFVYGRKQIQ